MKLEKTKIVAAVWVLGIVLFAGWVIATLGGILFGLAIKSQAYADLLAWLIVWGFALGGFIISIGFVLKSAWKLSDEDIFEKPPKILKTRMG
ncbi:hypothetical protein ES706_05755 [subsurface metagenome]